MLEALPVTAPQRRRAFSSLCPSSMGGDFGDLLQWYVANSLPRSV